MTAKTTMKRKTVVRMGRYHATSSAWPTTSPTMKFTL